MSADAVYAYSVSVFAPVLRFGVILVSVVQDSIEAFEAFGLETPLHLQKMSHTKPK